MYSHQISIIYVYKIIYNMIHLFSEKLIHNYHDNKFMQRVYNKYKDGGKIYYQILEVCNQDELKTREKYWIDKLNPDINIVKDPTMENSSKATNRKVEILDTVSGLSKIYNSIADAARSICEPQDNFNSICASISVVCHNKGKLVKHRYKCKYL